MIEEVLAFWFGEPATTADDYGRKIRRWFMGGPALDSEIRDRFGALVERALAGELDDWTNTAHGRLALILVLDQFTRSIHRNDPKQYAGDARAQAFTACSTRTAGCGGSTRHITRRARSTGSPARARTRSRSRSTRRSKRVRWCAEPFPTSFFEQQA